MDLSLFPRIRLGHFPTPLEPMGNLSALLGGPRLWVKRDDCTGLSTGGNKTRKLEYLMAEAVAARANVVITQGATQSNHARQTAAAAARLGMKCHILLEDRTGSTDPDYTDNGNVLLNRLHGATVERRPGGADMQREMEQVAEKLRADGLRPYVIPGGGSNPVGALGYVNAAFELVAQAAAQGMKIDYLVHATGSSGTQAGLVAGLHAINSDIKLLGTGHCIVTVAPARWISTRMRSWLGLACVGAGVTGDATGPGATVGANGNATKAGVLSESCSRLRLCSRSQRCTMFGCRPWLKATPATEAPGSRVRARTDALKTALYSRRSRRSPSINRSIVSTISFVGTILDYCPRFKMGSPRAYPEAAPAVTVLSPGELLRASHPYPCTARIDARPVDHHSVCERIQSGSSGNGADSSGRCVAATKPDRARPSGGEAAGGSIGGQRGTAKDCGLFSEPQRASTARPAGATPCPARRPQ